MSNIEDLQKKNQELEEQLENYKDLLKKQTETNASLINQMLELKRSQTAATLLAQNMSAQFEALNIVLGVYQANCHYENINTNLQISLTDLAARFKAKSTVLLKKNPLEEYEALVSSINYNYTDKNERDETTLQFINKFKLRSEFPLITHELETITGTSPVVVNMPDIVSQSATCREFNISSITITPIIINNNVEYMLAILDPQVDIEPSLLSCISIAYSDSLNRINKEKLIQQLAITDNLTGLYDRTYYNQVTDRLEREQPSSVGYIMVDLFRLKYVNDNFGHETGDAYIKSIANVLKKFFVTDYAFRLGGDEFCVIVVNKPYQYIEDMLELVNREISSIEIYDRNGNKVLSRIDTGVDYQTERISFKELAHNADIKMNENKNRYYEENGINRRK